MRDRSAPAGTRRVVHYAAAAVAGGLLEHVRILASRSPQHGYLAEAWIRPIPDLDLVASEIARAGAAVRRLTVRGKGDLPGLLAFARALRSARPDILHVHLASPVESLPVILAASILGPRIVLTEHAPTYHPLERRWSRALKRRAVGRVDRVIVLAETDVEYLVETFGLPRAKIRHLPNGVDLDMPLPPRDEARRRLGIPAGPIVLGYVGEIAEKKGLADLADAMAVLAAREGSPAGDVAAPVPIALLAGEGAFAPALRERSARRGLGAAFRLLGALRPPLDLLAACDIFVFPSHGEAAPLAVLEAMAAGLPVVATGVGGIPGLIRDGVEGSIVRPRDPVGLASAIRSLAGDASARERMGAAARRRVQESFGAGRMAEAVCALYDEVLEVIR